MIEIETKDGSIYMLDPFLIACIARKKWKNLDSGEHLQTKDVCSIYWMGGGQIHVAGANYEELCKLWRAQRTEILEVETHMTHEQMMQATRPDKK